MLEFLIKDENIDKNDRIAVGVSGGADSMLLLWALKDKQKQSGFYFEVIHVNHHLRGKDSDNDCTFVNEFCKKQKIPCNIVDVDVNRLKSDTKTTLEECARMARYDAFNSVMKKNKLNKLFLAHHKNDQVETILMHIFRGSGISGAVGMKNTDTILRPLLELSKEEIVKLCAEHGIAYVQDSTNSENDYARNYLRNVILPQVEEVYTGLINNVVKFGKRCEEVQNYILSQIDDKLIEVSEEEVYLNQQIFEKESFFVREYLKRAFEKLNVFSDIESKHYKMIYELSKMDVNKEISLPHKLIARKTYGGVKIFIAGRTSSTDQQYQFLKSGEICFGNFKIVTSVVSASDVFYGDALFVDANKISTNAVWRTRKQGDKFSKIGTGSKKLNDYLTNNKVDHDLRNRLPILASGETVLVVAGDDVSENVKIDATTDEIVKITFDTL